MAVTDRSHCACRSCPRPVWLRCAVAVAVELLRSACAAHVLRLWCGCAVPLLCWCCGCDVAAGAVASEWLRRGPV
eukprot:6833677-Alexandrium_andersonii.AAC.1